MDRPFYIVGPTTVGKSEIAAEVAQRLGAEVLSADAFQIYRGLDLLTAKPDRATLEKAPHHLIGTVPLGEEMNAEKFRAAAQKILSRDKPIVVVGGTGLYVKALTHGIAKLSAANPELRARLERTTNEELFRSFKALDPVGAGKIDAQNRRRLIRAIEVCLITRKPFSAQHTEWNESTPANGVLLERDRAELYARINQRVEEMFAAGVVDEVRVAKNIGPTAEKTLGLREIQALIAGEISRAECIAKVQQATRRYAKRQLTWFRRQTNFPSLNLSAHDPVEAAELISQSASRVFAGE
ncbi:MAG TPA: tRNA (adenosine(37)-N6)-dimethylallyltransferase MiaA [Chthoniobacterales bacterium]|nr:tRNA (adenosine(37)-N6)-dimethylallyltransferase MiaA [Chthoniobacterales bacterium]